MLRLRAAALAVCLVATPAAAQLYRWTDGEGTVHYTADLDAIPPAHRAAAQLLSAPQPRPAPPPEPPWTRSPSPSTRPRAARRSRRDDEHNLGDAIVTRFGKRLSGVRHQVL